MRSSVLVFALVTGAMPGCGDIPRYETPPPRCGDGWVDPGEICDGANLASNTCATVAGGFGGGTLACNATCDGWDTSACTPGARCGDGTINGHEACDGTDLGGATCASLGFASGTVACDASCMLDMSGCVVPPDTWTCAAQKYGTGDGCDCGCGVIDPDCSDGFGSSCATCNGTGSCGTSACPGAINPSDNTRCVAVAPAAWRCLDDYYFDTDCDCGCGAPDPACADGTAASCNWCDDPGSCSTACPGNIDATDNSTCTVPQQWTCDVTKYGTGDGCDCGCGSIDPDCTDVTASACATCNATGSCSTTACPGTIDPGNITSCTM